MLERIPRGELDRIVEILKPVDPKGKDSFGGGRVSFSTLTKKWAKIEYTSAMETEAADKQTAVNTCLATFDYVPGLNATMLLVLDGDRYRITGVKTLGRNQYHIVNIDKTELD